MQQTEEILSLKNDLLLLLSNLSAYILAVQHDVMLDIFENADGDLKVIRKGLDDARKTIAKIQNPGDS